MQDTKTVTRQTSSIENGVEICNTCVRPIEKPFRYRANSGEVRGCVSACHDQHVGEVKNPYSDKPSILLPKWIRQARAQINKLNS